MRRNNSAQRRRASCSGTGTGAAYSCFSANADSRGYGGPLCVAGFGRLHTDRVLRLSTDLPVIVEVVEEEAPHPGAPSRTRHHDRWRLGHVGEGQSHSVPLGSRRFRGRLKKWGKPR
ncbi:MAG: DUF190 domain-containing protein [Acidimicrobiia bacterium]